MYWREKAETRNAFAAMLRAAAAPGDVDVWPENWPAFQLFVRLQTQWRHGIAGPTGLCYEVVYPLIDRMGLSPDEWDQMLDDIAHMEAAALAAMKESTE